MYSSHVSYSNSRNVQNIKYYKNKFILSLTKIQHQPLIKVIIIIGLINTIIIIIIIILKTTRSSSDRRYIIHSWWHVVRRDRNVWSSSVDVLLDWAYHNGIEFIINYFVWFLFNKHSLTIVSLVPLCTKGQRDIWVEVFHAQDAKVAFRRNPSLLPSWILNERWSQNYHLTFAFLNTNFNDWVVINRDDWCSSIL